MTFTYNLGFHSIAKGNVTVRVGFYVGQKGMITCHVARATIIKVPVATGGSTQRCVSDIGPVGCVFYSPFQP